MSIAVLAPLMMCDPANRRVTLAACAHRAGVAKSQNQRRRHVHRGLEKGLYRSAFQNPPGIVQYPSGAGWAPGGAGEASRAAARKDRNAERKAGSRRPVAAWSARGGSV